MNQRFGIGEVLGTGFQAWARNLVPFLFITVLISTPLLIWGAWHAGDPMNVKDLHRFKLYLSGGHFFLSHLISGALTYGVIMELQGQRASVGSCIGVGLSRFFPMLGVSLLSGLCVLLGVIALIVGAIVVTCMLYVATAVTVIERPGVLASLGRSRALTKGHRLEIFAILMLIGMIATPLQLILDHVVVRSFGTQAYAYGLMTVELVTGSLGAVMMAVTYFYLRQEKEGTSAVELGRLFE